MDLNDRIIDSLVAMGAISDPAVTVAGPIRWQAVFFIGPAGSGKSYIKTKRYLRHLDFKEVDPDAIKKTHPDYDPENPFTLHAWSKVVADSQLNKILSDGSGSPVIIDGTGRNAAGVAKKINNAKRNGYNTYLVYVYVPLEISIWRNRNRKRFVPEAKILEQSQKIGKSFQRLKGMVTKVKVIPNYEKREFSEASKDIQLYPVPQKVRPPRPGSPDYGQPMAKAAADLRRLARQI